MTPKGLSDVSAVTKLLEGHRAAALLLIVVLGFVLRLHGIDQFGITYPEMGNSQLVDICVLASP